MARREGHHWPQRGDTKKILYKSIMPTHTHTSDVHSLSLPCTSIQFDIFRSQTKVCDSSLSPQHHCTCFGTVQMRRSRKWTKRIWAENWRKCKWILVKIPGPSWSSWEILDTNRFTIALATTLNNNFWISHCVSIFHMTHVLGRKLKIGAKMLPLNSR